MESDPRYYNPNDYVLTKFQTKVSRHNTILGLDNIQVGKNGIFKEHIILRADLAAIKMGDYVILCESVIIKPCYRRVKNQLKYQPLVIGNNVLIDQKSIIQAFKIGNNVVIGKNCVIGNCVTINDNVYILDDSIIPPDMKLDSFSVYGGKPAIYLGEMCEQGCSILRQKSIDYFRSFVVHPQQMQQRQQQLLKSQQVQQQSKQNTQEKEIKENN